MVLSLPHLTLHSHISIVANFGASTPAYLFALYFDIPTQCKEETINFLCNAELCVYPIYRYSVTGKGYEISTSISYCLKATFSLG